MRAKRYRLVYRGLETEPTIECRTMRRIEGVGDFPSPATALIPNKPWTYTPYLSEEGSESAKTAILDAKRTWRYILRTLENHKKQLLRDLADTEKKLKEFRKQLTQISRLGDDFGIKR